MKRALVVVVGIAVLAGVVAGLRLAGIRKGYGNRRVEVRLTMQNGVCRAEDPALLGGAYLQQVFWDVQNVNCPAPQYVRFEEFKKKVPGGYDPPDPDVVAPNPATTPQAIEQGVALPVHTRINRLYWIEEPTYKYKICVGPAPASLPACTDPEVDVWPVF